MLRFFTYFLEKEKNRIIYIPREKIAFTILRIYYQRISGLEIFTIDNKSYYFNFKTEIQTQSNEKTNNVIDILKKNFSVIQTKNITTLGWYNQDYYKIYFPLFSEDINFWKEKHMYSNFDKLMIINLLSNRSSNDLNQYPIFPMLYDEISLKRKMDKPIGFQDIEEESQNRTQIIQDSYYYEKEFGNEDNPDLCFFNIFFSNIIFVCNYLIRVYPFSFLAIEAQGDGFDSPNRLFYSIKSAMNKTLSQRSDLRELIPEMFYFPPLFFNMNNIQLNKLSDGSSIDNVYIKDKQEKPIEIYQFLKNMRNNLEKEENLNQWIDLIFGINKDTNEKKERYYNPNRNVEFKYKPELTNDDLMMQSFDFGVLPLQLFNENFPKQNIISDDLNSEIINFNYDQFKSDHIPCLYDEKISFICQGEKGINSKYNKLINKSKKGNFLDTITNFSIFNSNKNKSYNINYLFTGDVFGNLSVYYQENNNENYKKKSKKEDFKENIKEKQFLDDIKDKKYKLLKILHDHNKEIKYIDYNPRLNILADYSLDGFINLYIMPSLQLIRVIQTKDFYIQGTINKIALIAYPFPILCFASDLNICVLDINVEFLRNKPIKEGPKFEFAVDKNCGRVEDYVNFENQESIDAQSLI